MSRQFWMIAGAFHLIACALTLWTGWFVTRRIRRPASTRGGWAAPTLALASLASVVFVAAYVAAHLLDAPLFAFPRFVAQAVFGEALLLSCWLAAVSGRAARRLATTFFGAFTLLLLATYWEAYQRCPFDLQVRQHRLEPSAPTLSRPIRVLHLSDLQVWHVGDFERRVVREAVALEPDIVVLTGDYVQERLTPTRADALRDLRELLRAASLSAPLGVYAVWGNRHVFDGLDVRCLEDEVARVRLPHGQTLAVVGLSWPTSATPQTRRIEALMSRAGSADRCIVAGHAPDFALTLASSMKADLILAGHTHGGQVCLPWLGPLRHIGAVPAWLAAGGLHEIDGTPVHVSRGIGMERASAPQMRLLCPPEICVIELR
jgi:predicted MPP superfamily phosphohydrolase